jgi:hypothetical protein
VALQRADRLFKKAYSINMLETSSEILRCHVKLWIMWRTGDRYRHDNSSLAWYAT